MQTTVERWDIFEFAANGRSDGNPFVDVVFSAEFWHQHRTISVEGFYDGDGRYVVRFMPDTLGEWQFTTRSNVTELDNLHGAFTCVPPSAGNHGPVSVERTYHFAYADGTPYYPFGTTCYVWTHQGEALEEQTLRTLAQAPFNKLRMCIFPKHYPYNQNEPALYPFERDADGKWDFTRFNPAFFRHHERRIAQLRALGIEADLILFHPYDEGHWGFDRMPAEADDRYLRYVIARLAAFRNVWWSLANEYDLMEEKTSADWDRFFRIVQQSDPYQHLRSIHNCRAFYDHGKPWVTHASIQFADVEQVSEWRRLYDKPIVVDECRYEGNIPHRWGNITAQEMVSKFWEGTVNGGYVGHGETYLRPNDELWWSKGGVLIGESPARIAFLRQLLDDAPPGGLDAWREDANINRDQFPTAGCEGEYYLTYFRTAQPALARFELPEGEYRADIIDTWEMTITPLDRAVSGECSIELARKPYIAVRLRRVSS